jgi:hypothetical protein
VPCATGGWWCGEETIFGASPTDVQVSSAWAVKFALTLCANAGRDCGGNGCWVNRQGDPSVVQTAAFLVLALVFKAAPSACVLQVGRG